MPKRGKKYLEAAKKVDRMRYYSPEEAVRLAKEVAYANFDATIEAHLRMGLDPRKADQQIRGVVLLPHGTGKKVRILVFAEGEAAKVAEEAGADSVGSDDLVKKIQDGGLDFDVAFAIPQMMGKVGRLGRILGPRGLMPSPKAHTVVQPDALPQAIKEARQGRVEYRLDRTANVHMLIGKASFSDEALLENLAAVLDAILRAKPSGAKGQYIRRLPLAPTMGPGIKVDLPQAVAMVRS